MGADHPIAWWHDFDGGRAWYTAMGHTTESYSDPLFLQLLLGGIGYAGDLGQTAAPHTAFVLAAARAAGAAARAGARLLGTT